MTTKKTEPGAAPDTYYGLPILTMHVGDPIPCPRGPRRYIVNVTPDLARYILTLQHPLQRHEKPTMQLKYARDMDAGRWVPSPQCVVFEREHGYCIDGLNRLVAITIHGQPVWMIFDFGWPPELMYVLDRGLAKSNADSLKGIGASDASTTAAAITKWVLYKRHVGTTTAWSGAAASPPTSNEAIAAREADAEGWVRAVRAGRAAYLNLDHALSAAVWAAVYHAIEEVHGDRAEAFFAEVLDGSGRSGSPSRVLADWSRRRTLKRTRTGDVREPMEVIIRAFNAWLSGRPLALPKFAGFKLSTIRG